MIDSFSCMPNVATLDFYNICIEKTLPQDHEKTSCPTLLRLNLSFLYMLKSQPVVSILSFIILTLPSSNRCQKKKFNAYFLIQKDNFVTSSQSQISIQHVDIEPLRENSNNLGFQACQTNEAVQPHIIGRSLKYQILKKIGIRLPLERKQRLISCAVTALLTYTFVFAYEDCCLVF